MPAAWLAHPAFAPYRAWLGDGAQPPSLDALDALACARGGAVHGRPIAFRDVASHGALDYERRIAATGVIATRRGSWHDAFNALAWIAWPRAKAALNALHVRRGAHATANRRDRARDAATLLDESGLLVACADPSFATLLRAHAWRELFAAPNAAAARAVVVAFGHGLLDRLREPYAALTGRALVLPAGADPDALHDPAALDAAAARAVADAAFGPETLLPLPVAALPGWDAERRGPERFDDVQVFRPARGAGRPTFGTGAAS
jgi:hypothetical protein